MSVKTYPEEELLRMRVCEDRHAWYLTLDGLVFDALVQFGPGRNQTASLLDLGCGTGRLLQKIEEKFPPWNCSGLDLSPEAAALTESRGLRAAVFLGSGDRLPFADGTFDIVIVLDVLYIQTLNEKKCLEEIKRVLKPEGTVIINVPAHDWLRSSHDSVIQTRSRYNLNELKAKVEQNGFKTLRASYWNFFLFLPLVLFRFFKKAGARKPASDLEFQISPRMNGFLGGLFAAERQLIKHISLPAGSSIFMTIRKPL